MLTKILAPFLLILHLLGTHPQTTKMVDQVSSSVVRITGEADEMTMFGPEHVHYICSGEVIAPNRVLTAAHCVGENMLSDGVKAVALKIDKKTDLALLVTLTDKPALTFRNEDPIRFESLTAVGYAFGMEKLTALSVRVLIVSVAPFDDMVPGILVQPGYVGGMSGGPVVDADGVMVGIIQASADGIGYGVGNTLIKAFLVGQDLPLH